MPCSAPPHSGSLALKTQPTCRTLELVPLRLLRGLLLYKRHRPSVSSATAGREGDSQPSQADYRRRAP